MKFWRINCVLLLFLAFGLVILGQLFSLQVIKGDLYKALAQGQYIASDAIKSARGEILFNKGEFLAVNVDWILLFCSPAEMEDKEAAAKSLSEALLIDENVLLEKFQEDSVYEVIKKRLSDEEAAKVKELNIKGVHLGKESGRYYPQEEMGSKIAGFLDADGLGQYGLEKYYDQELKGKKKSQGSDIVLTVDYSIQFTAENLLKAAKENLNIEGGEIIVMEPSTGRILAMAGFPNYNPNEYSKVEDFDIFQNAATEKIFEPGSVFKPITMAAAINEGKISPETTYKDQGEVRIGGYKITNYANRIYPGDITMTQVLEKSINTGAVFAEQQLGNTLFEKYIGKFGIFEATGVDLQETYSRNQEFKKGYDINFATAAFGQGIEMTPLQLLRAYSAIANDGKMVRPYIVDEIKGVDSYEKIKPEVEKEQIISSKTVSQVTSMMISVIDNGYSKSAKIPGYYLAGKTGTAQISWAALGEDKKGYSDKTWQSFVGFGPAFNPRFLIMVKLDNPGTKTAEYSAIPIFHDLAKYIIDYYQIPPDYEQE